MHDLSHLRSDFPILEREVNGERLIYLDSAATTQKPISVLNAMDDYYRSHNANVHRGAHTLSNEATELYEGARARIARFIGAEQGELVLTRGATTSINHIAYGWGLNHLKKGDKILLTVMEHHANIVPWQLIAKHNGAELIYLELNDDYTVNTDSLNDLLNDSIKVIAFSGMSNVTGVLGPVDILTEAAKSVGALSVMDAAQLIPHAPVDVTELGVDFVAFSAHKMLGPTGVGALWGRSERLEEMEPTEGGGEMINTVGRNTSTWAPIPHRFEAGTPPIAEAIGFGAAIEYLEAVGVKTIMEYERELTTYAIKELSEIPDLKIHGQRGSEKRGGAISFELADIHAHDIATILDQDGIAVRAGHHCAKPLMKHLDVPATARVSFYLYNTPEEVDSLVESLHKARKLFGLT